MLLRYDRVPEDLQHKGRGADSFYYNWDFTDDTQYDKNAEGMVTLASKADENTLTYTQKTATHNAAAGLSNNSGKYFSMEKDVALGDKAKWTIEWRGVQKNEQQRSAPVQQRQRL
ncbi:MAG: hypothetical protein V8T46_02810 [Sutterella seckii]